MTTYAKLRCDAIVFNPTPAAGHAAGELYRDQGSGQFSEKDVGEGTVPIGAAPDTSLFKKQMQSGYVGLISVGTPLAKMPNGKVTPTDSDGVNTQQFIGWASEAFAALDDLGLVQLPAPNVVAVITGLGFAPGDEIFIDETSGVMTNNPATFTGDNDSLIKIGIADCAAGAASGTATDLIAVYQVVNRP